MNKLRIFSVFVLLAMLISLAGVSPATATLVDTPWTGSGPGTITVVSDGSGAPAQFTYAYSDWYSGEWAFSTTAGADGNHTLDWHYSGLHSWFQVTVGLDAFIENNGTLIMTTNLVSAGPEVCCITPSNGFDYSGTFTFVDVQAGDTYGFKLRGSHFDYSMILRGTLTLSENSAPSADAGGPYSGDEGSPISLDGSASFDPDGDPLTYAWTVLPALCSFDDPASATPVLTCPDNGEFTVTLMVDDGVATDSATAALTVNNVAPTVNIDSVSPLLTAVGTPVTASGSFTDPGTNDTHTAAWDWGDANTSAGSVSGLIVGPDSHTYTAAGIYQLQLEVTDNDGGSGSALYQFVVVYDPTDGFVTGGGWFMSPAGAYYPAGLPSFGDSFYQVVLSSLNWADASAAASASELEGCSSAHLATITSQEEQDAIYNSFGGDAIAFAWLGAHLEAGGWQWVTAEPWDYTNWQAGEPTGKGENALMVGGGGTPSDGGWIYDGKWNDTFDTGLLQKYIIEYEDCLVGKATFGFVSKYQKGANVPTGNTEFQFHAADLNFHSTSYEWLVVTGSNFARFKGAGTINGAGEYLFMLWAGDGTGSAGADTFRIKIWTEAVPGEELIIYDNGMNQAISGGNILVHSN